MSNEIIRAMATLRTALKDQEYAYAWHANIAMAFEDELMANKSNDAHVICNDAATRVMSIFFDVRTSADMLLDEPEAK